MTEHEALELVEQLLQQGHLNDLQKIIFQGTWRGLSYSEILTEASQQHQHCSYGHLKNESAQLWKHLTDHLPPEVTQGEKITKFNLRERLERYQQAHTALSRSAPRLSLDQIIDVSRFCGRSAELQRLKECLSERCRVVAVVGISGVGKTSLVAKFVQEQFSNLLTQDPLQRSHSDSAKLGFEQVIWRSLHAAPAIPNLLAGLLEAMTGETVAQNSSVDQQMVELFSHLRRRRYLVVLDEWESLLQEGALAGHCAKEHQGYSRLLKRWAEENHQSCLLITSREQPVELMPLHYPQVGLLKLKGLLPQDAAALLVAGGFTAHQPGLIELIQIHRGNPAALKVVASMIQRLFGGNITQFLEQTSLVVGDVLAERLDQQFERLSDVEKVILYRLALADRVAALAQLKSAGTLSSSELLTALDSLQRRSLIECVHQTDTEGVHFSVEPVVRKYVTQRLITQICQEIESALQIQSPASFDLLKRLALVSKALTQNPVTHEPPLLFRRIRDRLQPCFGDDQQRFKAELNQMLSTLQTQPALAVGYAETNLLQLLDTLNGSA
jgi:hypothetical protein